MKELAKRFIGKECVISSFDGNHQYEGIIKEVTDGAILVEKDGKIEALNLDFVIRIREYPRNKKGKQSFLGVFTVEESFTQFRTLGAKRYVERWRSDGKLHLTVAGINKEAVSCLNDDIENFKDGLVFDKDEKDVTKLLHTYIDSMPEIVFPDGYVSTQKRGVNLRPNGYKLKVDALGLDETDYHLLKSIIEKFNGGPVGIEAIASSIGEEQTTIEDVYEPYLMQIGFLSRTPRGRMVTPAAYRHLGLPMPGQQSLL